MNPEELQSRTISFLRFPMIVAVVLIHDQFAGSVLSSFPADSFPWYRNISFVISQLLTKPVVPLFFLISGYLFFYRIENFTFQVYRQKISRRIHTLLIPYLLWNTLILVLSYVRQRFFGEIGASSIGVADFGLADFLKSYWGTGSGSASRPIAFQFWFIRDLMVVTLMTPLIHFLVRKTGFLFILVTGLLWYSDLWFDITGFSIMSIFFFSLGASLSIRKMNLTTLAGTRCRVWMIVYILLIINLFLTKNNKVFPYLDNMAILIGMTLMLSMTSHFIAEGKWKEMPFLTRSSFFIFAFHGLAISWILKFSVMLLHPQADSVFLTIYILAPIMVVAAGLLCYALLERYLPRLTALLTGNRSRLS